MQLLPKCFGAKRRAGHFPQAARRAWRQSSISAAGVMPGRRAAAPMVGGRTWARRARTSRLRPGDGVEVEVAGQQQGLIGAKGRDVRVLARQVAGVARFDFQLLDDIRSASRRVPARSRPGVTCLPPAGATAPGHCDTTPSRLTSRPWRRAALGLRRCSCKRRVASTSADCFAAKRRRRSKSTTPTATPLGVRRKSALSARSVSRYSRAR